MLYLLYEFISICSPLNGCVWISVQRLELDYHYFIQSRLEYLGQVIDEHGLRKDPSKVTAIVDFTPPDDVTSLKRFLGMMNQLMKVCPNLSDLTEPLKELLNRGVAWSWGEQHQKSFEAIKTELASDQILAMYNAEKET